MKQAFVMEYNSRGEPRQRWAPTPTPPGGVRQGKIAFRLSPQLRAEIAMLADRDRLPVSSWLERVVRTEVERRRLAMMAAEVVRASRARRQAPAHV